MNRQRIDAMVLARYFNDLETAVELVEVLKPHLGEAERIGLPAVLGMSDALGFVRELESRLGCRVFEIPGLPPSIPGMRLHRILVEAIQKSGGQVFQGMEAVSSQLSAANGQIEAIYTEAAARPTLHTAQNRIWRTG
jgi:glycerol-3-phosphate dehydrogenase subunit B